MQLNKYNLAEMSNFKLSSARHEFLLVCFLIINLCLFSQSIKRQSLNSAGNTGYGDGFYLKQTTGQSSNTNQVKDSQITLRQGFQQPVIDFAKLKPCATCELSVFPNPLNEKSVLHIPLKSKTYSVWICDALGKVIYFEKNLSTENINLYSYSFTTDATYLIRVLYEDGCNCVIKLIVSK